MLPGLEFHFLVLILGKTLFANCASWEGVCERKNKLNQSIKVVAKVFRYC